MFNELLQNSTSKEILSKLNENLKENTNESFFSQKAPKFTEVILSVILPLRDQNLLFTPEGKPIDEINVKEFLRWTDLVSLKTLYFTIKQSNSEDSLLRTQYEKSKADKYKNINIEILEIFIKENAINLDNEEYDFPIRNYNLHIGIASVIKNAMTKK